jgi:hypothetical protein
MSLAALKPRFDIGFTDRRIAARGPAEIATLPFLKSEASADGFTEEVRETLGGQLGYSVIAGYALFNLAFVITHFAI